MRNWKREEEEGKRKWEVDEEEEEGVDGGGSKKHIFRFAQVLLLDYQKIKSAAAAGDGDLGTGSSR